jgi:hypothetical protein
MKFDEFLSANGIVASPVDRFTGFVVEVGAPPGWVAFDSAPGLRVWVCRNDPMISEFCANAVLTMHHINAVLDTREVFTMLVEQQVEMVPGCCQLHRELTAATEGTGASGTLTLNVAHERGLVTSESLSRIITTEQETLIAQLTVTALHNSPVNRANVWLTVRHGAYA